MLTQVERSCTVIARTIITMKNLEIKFGGELTIPAIEREMALSFSESLLCTTTFDLRNVGWAGYFPSYLLFVWASHLRILGNEVEFRLPAYSALPTQVAKTFVGYGIFRELKALGVKLDYFSAPDPTDGVALELVKSSDGLWEELRRRANLLQKKASVPHELKTVLGDLFRLVVFELIENAHIHADGRLATYGMGWARSSGSRGKHGHGWTSVFPENTDYVEIHVGDLGVGLQKTLKTAMPDDYLPRVLTKHKFLKEERLLAYAFEFSSTSNVKRRQEKIQELLDNTEIQSSQVASGLYCVLEFVRALAGQFIVRTGSTILSFDYQPDGSNVSIKGKKELGFTKLAALPGTHFLIRVPLSARHGRPSTGTSGDAGPKTVGFVDAFDAFDLDERVTTFAEYIRRAIALVDQALMSDPKSEKVLIIAPPRRILPSRAEAIFLAALHAMNQRGQRIIFLTNALSSASYHDEAGKFSGHSIFGSKTSILVGDLLRNRFQVAGGDTAMWDGIYTQQSGVDFEVQLVASVRQRVFDEYQRRLVAFLKTLLCSGDVRLTGKSFLIERKYYTDTFFVLSKLWADQFWLRALAEWALDKIDSDVELFICHSNTELWVRAIADLFHELYGVRANIIVHSSGTSPAETLAKTLRNAGKKAVIFTDVICKEARLNTLLSSITAVNIAKILTVVDGRPSERINKPLIWSNRDRSVGIEAIYSESITIHREAPYPSSENSSDDSDERVFIIDESTRAPTLYARKVRPEIDLDSLLTTEVQQARALGLGHLEFRDRHYTYFLDLPNLFASFLEKIKAWISEQLDFVDRVEQRSWEAFLYNPDGSLSAAERFLNENAKISAIRSLTWDEIRAPAYGERTLADRSALILIPAVASGETIRLLIEYVAAQRPESILVLCLTARADPYHLRFLSSIKNYSSSIFRISYFMDFPIPSFRISDKDCPKCREVQELEQVATLVRQHGGELLSAAIEQKLAASVAVKIDAEERGSESLSVEPETFERAYLRALYSRAKQDLEARRSFNGLLESDDQMLDRFLEVISLERHNWAFSEKEFKNRLFKANNRSRLHERILRIVEGEVPPYRVSEVLGAVIHLAPQEFLSNATLMVMRFAESYSDIEEICIALLILGASPLDLPLLASSNLPQRVQLLLGETLSVIDKSRNVRDAKFVESIAAIGKMRSQIIRSTEFHVPIGHLIAEGILTMPWDDIQSHTEEVWRSWRSDIADLLAKISSGPLWKRLTRTHSRLPKLFQKMSRSVGELATLGKERPNDTDEFLVRQEVQEKAREIELTGLDIANRLSAFAVNPTLCVATRHDSVEIQGRSVEIKKSIDHYSPSVFCDPKTLDYLCGEIFGNWIRHGALPEHPKSEVENTSFQVSFGVSHEGDFVMLEFGDNFLGEFDLDSPGGLGSVRDICSDYGGLVSTRREDRWKYISVSLRAVSNWI